jgi:hypothetical protein
MEKFKNWWGTSKLWQKIAVVIGVLFLLNILLGSCMGPSRSQANYGQPGQTTVIHENSGGGFWNTVDGFVGGYWLGSRNRGYDNYNHDYNNYNQPKPNNNTNNNSGSTTVTPEKKNEYKPAESKTKSTVTPEKKNEYKPSGQPAPKNDYKPSGSQSKPSGGNQYKPK